jgi:membrane complex biogenesis BtpA family protein
VAVCHLGALPGAPLFAGSLEGVLERAVLDARAAVEGGADALIVENFGDRPFHRRAVPPETVAALTLATAEVRRAVPGVPVGVNVLRNDARAALAICAATGAEFLRVNVHVGVMLTDQGLVRGEAARTLRARARLAPDALVLADVHVKHAVPLVPRPLAEVAEEAVERGLADALLLTGARTGSAPERDELAAVRERLPGTPLLVGSGLDASNAASLVPPATGALCGTALKRGGRVDAPVDPERVRAVRAALDRSARG